MARASHACVAIIPAKKEKDGTDNPGLFRCEAYLCGFTGDLKGAIDHTIKHQPNFLTETE